MMRAALTPALVKAKTAARSRAVLRPVVAYRRVIMWANAPGAVGSKTCFNVNNSSMHVMHGGSYWRTALLRRQAAANSCYDCVSTHRQE